MRHWFAYTPASAASPSPERLAAIGKLTEEMVKSGTLVSTGGMLPTGGKVKLAKGKLTDGPCTEAKEVVIGRAMIDVRSKEEAYEHARRFLTAAGDGECELRQLVGPGIPG
jgi:hypothetical protein